MKTLFTAVIRAVVISAACSLFLGGTPPTKRPALQNNAIVDYKTLDINQLACIIGSDGPYADFLKNNVSGMEWPKGSGKTCVFTAGLWIGGLHRQTGTIRMAVQDYESEEQPGPFLSGEIFNTTTNNDSAWTARAADPRFRLYKVAKDTPGGNPATQLDPWTSWPGDLGAPFVDNKGNGVWDSTVDVPAFSGDEMIWCVINDCSVSRHHLASTTHPMGMEVQELFYAFNQPGVAGNIMFMKWKIINKSDADYDSVYLGEWSDIDLGDANDDVPGCDTTLGLGYVYNGYNTDAVYGIAPPADGLIVLEGPTVAGAPSDSAFVNGQWVKGFRNVPQSGFVAFVGGVGAFTDPWLGNSKFPAQAYNYLQGREGYTGQLLTSPTTGQPTTFWLSGDPVSGTGDLPSNFGAGKFAPRDIRIMNDCGPFTLAQGDTQEIVGAFVIAGGTSNLNSITALRASATVAREVFFNNGVVGLNEPPLAAMPARFALEQNYPNPFNPSSEIRYQISEFRHVTLVVYDVLGREVATLVNEMKQPGSYTVTFDGSKLASGVYYYRLEAGAFSQARKMLLVK